MPLRARALLLSVVTSHLAACGPTQVRVVSAPHATGTKSESVPSPPRAEPKEGASPVVEVLRDPAMSADDVVSCAPFAAASLEEVALDTRVVKSPIPEIEGDPDTLAKLHEKLARIARGSREKVRIALYGDSNMTPDFISGALRRELQSRFGDAGHGFVAAIRPWPWYLHMDVAHGVTKEGTWKVIATSTAPVKDGLYGFANMAAESGEVNARTWVMTAPESKGDPSRKGTRASSAEIFFLTRPYGGKFAVLVDGEKKLDVNATARATEAGFARASFPDGPHRVEAAVRSGNKVRFFGIALERDEPGVVVDSLGTGALNYEQMTHVESKTRRAMLAERNYDLVVFLLGTNMFAPDMHAKWVKNALTDFHAALPETPLLILSPPDVGKNSKDWSSDPRIAKMAAQFREIAKSEGALYWDFFAAMGGNGAMKNFAKNKIALRDFVHLGPKGGALMGARFAHEIMRGYRAYVAAHDDAGCAARDQ